DGHNGHSDKSGNSDNGSLLDKAWQAGKDAFNHTVDKVTDTFNNAMHDPKSLLNQGADIIKDQFGKGAADTLGKVFGVTAGSHPTGDAGASAHPTDGTSIGTTHPALTAQTSDHSHGNWSAINPQPLPPGPEMSALNALEHLNWSALNPQPLPPGPEMSALNALEHLNWSALNPQPLPPGPEMSALSA